MDGEYGSGNGRVSVKGLSKSLRALERAGADAQDMKDLMHEIGMIVVRASNPPTLSGALGGTLRAGRGKTKAVIRAGGARAPYAGVIEYGWPARNIAAANYLGAALQAKRGDAFRALDDGIAAILRNNDLT